MLSQQENVKQKCLLTVPFLLSLFSFFFPFAGLEHVAMFNLTIDETELLQFLSFSEYI